jgi:uncharacterized phage protein (TIGR02218 family)
MPRSASAALISALATRPELLRADLFTFTLQSGAVYRWTSWATDISDPNGNYFTSAQPWLNRGKWNLTNKMSVPSLTVNLMADNTGFAGGAQIKQQIQNGLFDGATCLLQHAFMATPGVTATFGTLNIFSGVVGAISVEGGLAKITVKGKNNLLDQYAPRHVYQKGCNHAFCDAGCGLSRTSFTASYSVSSTPAPTRTFIPWTSAPATPGVYLGGTVTMTSGAAGGQSQTVAAVTSSGLTLAYPLSVAPSAGDTFSAFQGCDKTYNGVNGGGSVQSCTAYNNTANIDDFPFVPPPGSAY